jgi:ABC-2 type transport system permease protein
MWANEIAIMFRRRRTVGLLAVLALVPVAAAVAVRLAGGPSSGQGPTFLSLIRFNGVFVSLAGLVLVTPIFLPLATSVVAGDAIAGEAAFGTLRYLLVRPVSRTRLLLVKSLAVTVFCLVASLVVVVAGLIAGSLLFPVGRVATLSGFEISLAAGIGRALLSAVVVAGSMLGLASIGLFASCLTDSPIAATAVAVVIVIASQIADSISQLDPIHPWLFTHGWLAFVDLMRVPMRFGSIGRDLRLQLGWIAVFWSAAWARLRTADVLS